jgi:hypothetical protein
MDTFDEIEKIKRAIRSSHAIMFNMNTVDVDLDDNHLPVFKPRNRGVKSNEPIKDESPQKP